MRWFQHFTDAHDHPDLVRIMEIGGPAAYGVWWLILERIGQQLVSEKSNTAVTFSVKTWAKFCGVSSKIFLKICENLEKPGQLLLKKNEDMLTIDCPTILNYCDEYSKKRFRASKQTPDSVRTNSGECPTRIEENKGEQKRKEGVEEKSTPLSLSLSKKQPKEKEPLRKFLDYVYLTAKDYEKLVESLGENRAEDMIERLNGYIGQIGEDKARKKYASHYMTILNWHRGDVAEGKWHEPKPGDSDWYPSEDYIKWAMGYPGVEKPEK